MPRGCVRLSGDVRGCCRLRLEAEAESIDADVIVYGGPSLTAEEDLVGVVAGVQEREGVEGP